MEHTKLIAMRKNLGLGHKGDILLTTQERVDNNQEPIVKDVIDEEYAQELVRRWNSQPDLLEACEVAILALTHQPINQKDIEFIQQAIAKAEKGD